MPATRARQSASFAVAAAALALALPADALAAKTFRGETQQDRRVTVRVGDDGVVERVRIAWKTRRCRLGGSHFRDATQFSGRFDVATPDEILDAGSYVARDAGRVRSRIRIRLAGRRVFDAENPSAERWEGTLRARVVVRRRGKVLDRCTLRSIGWRATLVP